jgi:hypothetical protein
MRQLTEAQVRAYQARVQAISDDLMAAADRASTEYSEATDRAAAWGASMAHGKAVMDATVAVQEIMRDLLVDLGVDMPTSH